MSRNAKLVERERSDRSRQKRKWRERDRAFGAEADQPDADGQLGRGQQHRDPS